jgi:hypothetical protein
MSAEPVFVFGSNLEGRHGKGAALWAFEHRGAIRGQGFGRQGNAYAIPTKGPDPRDHGPHKRLVSLPLDQIRYYVNLFLDVARDTPETEYFLTAIGCGLAGYTPEQIAPMFADAPANVLMPPEFTRVLNHNAPDP